MYQNKNKVKLGHGGPTNKNKIISEWGRPDLNWSSRLPKPEGLTKLPHGPGYVGLNRMFAYIFYHDYSWDDNVILTFPEKNY